jgi:LuxR family quorum-sensing system transcriptional regulator CciR
MTEAGDSALDYRATLRSVQAFADTVQSAATLAELEHAVASATRELGFDHFAIVHHVNFGKLAPHAIRMSNYPELFVARIREGQFARDPVLRASERTNVGFLWSDIPKMIVLNDRDRNYMRMAGELGLAEGFTVPYHIPGETLGSCHFAVAEVGRLPTHNLAAAQSIGAFGFEAARRLVGMREDHANLLARRVPLTRRQRDCVVQVARGKSDTVIAQLLGLRPRTVNEYIESAKKRYLVSTRQQLIVRALFQSDICFTEVLA